MKKQANIYKEDENGVLFVRAFMVIESHLFSKSDKWWLLSEYNQWLESQRKLNELYRDKPEHWIDESNSASYTKFKSMRNIVAFVRSNYATQEVTGSPTSCYYNFLDKLFGKGNWEEYGL